MARRTSPTAVRAIHPNIPSTVDLDGFIDTATKLVDKVAECAGSDLDDQHLELLERWLAAHFYTVIYPTLKSKSIGSASQTFHTGTNGTKLESTPFGQQALALDTSGCLEKITGETVSLTWLGTDETDYDVEWN